MAASSPRRLQGRRHDSGRTCRHTSAGGEHPQSRSTCARSSPHGVASSSRECLGGCPPPLEIALSSGRSPHLSTTPSRGSLSGRFFGDSVEAGGVLLTRARTARAVGRFLSCQVKSSQGARTHDRHRRSRGEFAARVSQFTANVYTSTPKTPTLKPEACLRILMYPRVKMPSELDG